MEFLPRAVGVSFNSSRSDPDEEAECLAGTREEVLSQIQAWADDPSQACIFWLNGMAGRGKSTVARTIARMYHGKQQLGASFFFSKSSSETRKAAKFFTTIAAQLAEACPSLRPAITSAVKENKNVAEAILRDQWKQLIFKPLSGYDPGNNNNPMQSPLVLVVDALDECDSCHADILGCLAEAADLLTIKLRILVTSRPETPILSFFRRMPEGANLSLSLDQVSREEVDEDISRFYKKRFGDIVHGNLGCLPADWPGNASIAELVQKAEGLFIYAATICRFVERHDNVGIKLSPLPPFSAVSGVKHFPLLPRQRSRLPKEAKTDPSCCSGPRNSSLKQFCSTSRARAEYRQPDGRSCLLLRRPPNLMLCT